MTRYREKLDVKSEEDWKKIELLVGKVMDARTAVSGFGFGGRGGGRGRGGGDGGNADQGGDRNRNRFGTPTAEEQALEKAIEAKAPADEIKTKLAAVRESRKAKEAALRKLRWKGTGRVAESAFAASGSIGRSRAPVEIGPVPPPGSGGDLCLPIPDLRIWRR